MNALACFQRFMRSCLSEYRDDFAILYLDDLLVHSGSFEDHLKHARLVLQKLKKYGIKIKASKSHLFRREISYLGRILSADEYTIRPKNVDAVLGKLKKKPNSIIELRSLLGLVGYFRQATRNFNQIAKPLYDVLKNSDLTSRSKQPINCRKEHQSRSYNLLIHVTLPPILAFSFQLPFILHTDASAKGLGHALQNQLCVLGLLPYPDTSGCREQISQFQIRVFNNQTGYFQTLQGLSLLLTTFRCLQQFRSNELFIHNSESQRHKSTVGK